MDAATIAEGREIVGRMTPGEWVYCDTGVWSGKIRECHNGTQIANTPYMDDRPNDMEGIVWLRNHAAELLAAAEKIAAGPPEDVREAAYDWWDDRYADDAASIPDGNVMSEWIRSLTTPESREPEAAP